MERRNTMQDTAQEEPLRVEVRVEVAHLTHFRLLMGKQNLILRRHIPQRSYAPHLARETDGAAVLCRKTLI